MIAQIEDAIITRLRLGMGRMVTDIASYGGELDDDLPTVMRRFPAAWVTFGGITASEAYATSRQKTKATGQFVVMVGQRHIANEAAARRGGGGMGSYGLVYAVRRLLSEQDLGLAISPLKPGRVRTLYNTRLANQAFSVFACEFACGWIEQALSLGAWPVAPEQLDRPPLGGGDSGTDVPDQTAPHPDQIFVEHGGRLDQSDAAWLSTSLDYHLPGAVAPSASDLLNPTQE